jgi:tetratricopeptide (TPR) repeat protein
MERAEAPSLEALRRARELPTRLEPLADALANRGTILLRSDRPAEAAEMYRQSLALAELLWDERDLPLVPVLSNLGAALRRSGDLEGAEEHFRRGAEILRAVGVESIEWVVLLNNLAQLTAQRGAHGEALVLYQEARSVLERQSGGHHQRLPFLDLQIAKVQLHQGAFAAAGDILRDRLPVWRELLGADHPWVVEAEQLLAQARQESTSS